MKRLFRFWRKKFRRSTHIRMVLRHAHDHEQILLVCSRSGDGMWHLPGGRVRLDKKKCPTTSRAAVLLVKRILHAELMAVRVPFSCHRGHIGLHQIEVATGQVVTGDLSNIGGNYEYRWYTQSALLQSARVDAFTKHVINLMPVSVPDSRVYYLQTDNSRVA